MALLGGDIFFSCIVVRALQSRIYLGCGTVVIASLEICSIADTFTSRLLGASPLRVLKLGGGEAYRSGSTSIGTL